MLKVPKDPCVGGLVPAIDHAVVGETGKFKVGTQWEVLDFQKLVFE